MAGNDSTQGNSYRQQERSRRHTRNALSFLFFIAMASVFWTIQKLEEVTTVEVIVPLKMVNIPQDVIITTDLPPEMKAVVSDKGTEILPFFWNPQLDTLLVDFEQYDTHAITDNAAIVPAVLKQLLKEKLPPQSSVEEMSPDTQVFCFNRGVHRRLPVQLQGTISTDTQYNLDSYTFHPDSVDVYAPKRILDTMTAAYTEKVTLQDLTSTTTIPLKLARTRSVRFFPDTVKLRANVDILTRKTVEVYVQGTDFPEDKELRTFPATVTVTYLVSAAQAKQVDTGIFQVKVSYNDLKDDNSTTCQPVLTNMPSNITDAFFMPQQVEYLIEDIVHQHVEEDILEE